MLSAAFSSPLLDQDAFGSFHFEAAEADHPLSPSAQLPPEPHAKKRKRNQPGNPDPDAEVVALSPRALVTSHRYVCEVCNKGFQRDQNLQLHRRGHNLPWQLRPRGSGKDGVRKRVYVCPVPSCVHHNPSRALGDLTGIKKHFSRKHGEKKWKCDKCSKRYAVHSDWKAHVKNCGTRQYKCDCGIVFPRKDTLINHRAFCDALAEESARLLSSSTVVAVARNGNNIDQPMPQLEPTASQPQNLNSNPNPNPNPLLMNPLLMMSQHVNSPHILQPTTSIQTMITAPGTTSAISLLQKAVTSATPVHRAFGMNTVSQLHIGQLPISWHSGSHLTRDFLGVAPAQNTGSKPDHQELPISYAISPELPITMPPLGFGCNGSLRRLFALNNIDWTDCQDSVLGFASSVSFTQEM